MTKKLDLGKGLQAMGIMIKLAKELAHINDVATLGIKDAMLKRTATSTQIIAQLKSQIHDGYKGLSVELTETIKNF